MFLRTVIRINFYIVVGQVAAPCRCCRLSHVDVGGRSYFRLGEDLRCLLLAVVNGNTFRDNLQFSGCALKVEIYFLRVELDSGVAEGAEDSSPSFASWP